MRLRASRHRSCASRRVLSSAQPVERGLEDRFDVGRFAADGCGGEDEVQHLVEPEIGANLVCLLGGDEQRPSAAISRTFLSRAS